MSGDIHVCQLCSKHTVEWQLTATGLHSGRTKTWYACDKHIQALETIVSNAQLKSGGRGLIDIAITPWDYFSPSPS